MKKNDFGSLLKRDIGGKVFLLLCLKSLTQKQLCERIHHGDSGQKRIIQKYLEKFKKADYIVEDNERKEGMKKRIDELKSLDKKPRLYISLLRAYPHTTFYRANNLEPVIQYWQHLLPLKKRREMGRILDGMKDNILKGIKADGKLSFSISMLDLLNEPMNGWEDYANPEKLKDYDFNNEMRKIVALVFGEGALDLIQPSTKWDALEFLTLLFRTVFEQMVSYNQYRKAEGIFKKYYSQDSEATSNNSFLKESFLCKSSHLPDQKIGDPDIQDGYPEMLCYMSLFTYKQLRSGAMSRSSDMLKDMLKTMAMFHPKMITKDQMAVLAGFAGGVVAFNTFLSQLKRNGWIYQKGDSYGITKEGMKNAGDVPKQPVFKDIPVIRKTLEAQLEYLGKRMPKTDNPIYKHLQHIHEKLDDEEIEKFYEKVEKFKFILEIILETNPPTSEIARLLAAAKSLSRFEDLPWI